MQILEAEMLPGGWLLRTNDRDDLVSFLRRRINALVATALSNTGPTASPRDARRSTFQYTPLARPQVLLPPRRSGELALLDACHGCCRSPYCFF